ncbi:PEGA domain-containing protein [uncultured Ilyobacter sp.]|uniref:PEGA domain-containing protein n=1 Tax=uncultured Ilyobacter sp. TaxID=544433 RepID=UPI0029F560F5|nr:PEGA domain-containing protein [uncultured Ilyobacter sp.]
MSTSLVRRYGILIAAAALFVAGGCVERTMKITSDPQGARVFVNDEEVGVTPVKFSFLWYGDYDIILRKDGYQTLKTHHRVDAPWYQYPPFDLVSECLVATTIHDDHELPTYTLTADDPPAGTDLVDRALDLRSRAYFAEQEQ